MMWQEKLLTLVRSFLTLVFVAQRGDGSNALESVVKAAAEEVAMTAVAEAADKDNKRDDHQTSLKLGFLGLFHGLVFWKHGNIKTYLSCPKIPEKYLTPSTGIKCKNIVLHIPFAPR
jgi:hypothetical protein